MIFELARRESGWPVKKKVFLERGRFMEWCNTTIAVNIFPLLICKISKVKHWTDSRRKEAEMLFYDKMLLPHCSKSQQLSSLFCISSPFLFLVIPAQCLFLSFVKIVLGLVCGNTGLKFCSEFIGCFCNFVIGVKYFETSFYFNLGTRLNYYLL